jgi:hypothetical protein
MRQPRHKVRNYWAMGWGVSFGLLFLMAATMSFISDDKAKRASAVTYEVHYTYDTR